MQNFALLLNSMRIYAAHHQLAIQQFESDCCPSGVDCCEFCSKGLKKPDQDLTKEKDGEWFIDKTKEKITCLDVAVFLAGQSKDSGFCKDWDVFEDRCC